MAEEVDSAVFKKTQEILGSIIKRPPLTDKNLKRPPFRFLHDIITNVIKTTGFMKGLYSNEEMLSENIKDKDSKIAFLQKAIDALGIIVDQPVNVKPSKIVAGHEVQKTNEFLQLLGNAVKSKSDSKAAVQAVLEKSGPPQKERRASVDKRVKNAPDKTHSRSTTKTEGSKKGPLPSPAKKEAGKSREGEKNRSRSKETKTREKEKPKEKHHSKRDDSKTRSKSDSKKDKTSKHSKDTAKEVAKEEEEETPVRPGTVVQNGFLEDHGDELDENILADDSQLNDALLNGESLLSLQGNAEAVDMSDTLAGDSIIKLTSEESPVKMVQRAPSAQRPPSAHRPRPPSARSKRTKLGSDSEEAKVSAAPLAVTRPGSSFRMPDIRDGNSPLPRPPSARPSSSRPAPPRIRIRHIVENEEPSAIRPATAKVVENVILDQEIHSDEEDETFVMANDEPTENLEPPMLPVSDTLPTPEEDKGSLVKQLLETKKDLEGGSQQHKKVEIDKSQMIPAAVQRARETANKELEQLRLFIQNVSKTAHPLGRMLDYLQEDIDAMKTEIKVWKEEHRQNLAALHKEKSVTESTLEPLRVQLDDLDQLVQDQLDANSALKATILRNEERIQRMLAGVCRKS